MKTIHELQVPDLFKFHIESSRINEVAANVYYGYLITCIGGIINTPLLAFRVKPTRKHKGKKIFLDLHTHQVYSRLSDAQGAALCYARNYEIHLVEEINK